MMFSSWIFLHKYCFIDINHVYREAILKKSSLAASVLYACGYLFLLRKGTQNDATAIASNLLKLATFWQLAKASREAAIEGPTILHIFFVACLTIPSGN